MSSLLRYQRLFNPAFLHNDRPSRRQCPRDSGIFVHPSMTHASRTARREMLFDVIREQDADLVGVQEALDFQIDEIIAAAPVYAVVGIGRDDGGEAGEYSAILF